jgi:hypothetical protein
MFGPRDDPDALGYQAAIGIAVVRDHVDADRCVLGRSGGIVPGQGATIGVAVTGYQLTERQRATERAQELVVAQDTAVAVAIARIVSPTRERSDRLTDRNDVNAVDVAVGIDVTACRGSGLAGHTHRNSQNPVRHQSQWISFGAHVLDELALAWRCAWCGGVPPALCIGGAHRRPRVPPCASDRAARSRVVRTPRKLVQFIGMRSTMGGGPLTRSRSNRWL